MPRDSEQAVNTLTNETNSDASGAFRRLGPDAILDAVEAVGLRCDGRFQALASYENRVYQVGLSDAQPVVAKFYRPSRWSDEQIQEEHDFSLELVERDLPVVAPIVHNNATLHRHGPYRFAIYQCRGGRPPALDDAGQLTQLGRFVARLHNISELAAFEHRPELSLARYGEKPVAYLRHHDFVPADLLDAYCSVTDHALIAVRRVFDRAGSYRRLRLHGDLHAGNILATDDGPLVVDFDDCCSGPAMQDLWMFLSGGRANMELCLAALAEGYEQFRPFPAAELHLVEALRTLRQIHHAGWIAMRWEDPAFPRAFPWFNTQRFWQDHILNLREQLALMDEGPLGLVL